MAQFIGGLIFGAIGFAAFVYGTKNRNWKVLVIGVALMGFPYIMTSTVWTYVVGVGLCAVLYFWHDM
jgi:hypothetical protein